MADQVGKRIAMEPGVVVDTRFIRCFWPKLDKPTAIFADGSRGLYVEGPPTPRNIIFPADTVFAPGTRADCFFLRERVEVTLPSGKKDHEEYVAELSARETADLREGRVAEADLRRDKAFRHISADGRVLDKGGR